MIEVWINATFEDEVEALEKALESRFEEPAVVVSKDVQHVQVWGVEDSRFLPIVRFVKEFLRIGEQV